MKQKENYLKTYSDFFDLFDDNWEKKIHQIDIEKQLKRINYIQVKDPQEYLETNSNRVKIEHYITSTANQLNLYSLNILKLENWNIIFEDESNKHIQEFILQDRIIPLSTLLLIEPNVFKNRIVFIFLTVLKEKFELIDFTEKYYISSLWENKYIKKASSYGYDLNKALHKIEQINIGETESFRNSFTHKISPNIASGYFNEVVSVTNSNHKAIGFMSHPPVPINKILELSDSEIKNSIIAFDEMMNFLELI
ncbi:MAG: hypothetical protein JJ958_10615 [Balneola sp.]|nr:hypothetical protein [Balneola sp.]